jgi:hypothetical protein
MALTIRGKQRKVQDHLTGDDPIMDDEAKLGHVCFLLCRISI